MSQSWQKLRLWCWLGLSLLVLTVGIGWHQARRKVSACGVVARPGGHERGALWPVQGRLSRLAEHWTNEGEVLLLLGECELHRGRRQEALAAWAKVPPTAPSFAQAARFRASNLIQMGRYSPAEETLLQALANPGERGSDDLDRELVQLYRSEGRFDDLRRLLRAAWCRSTDPAGVLKELWMLDHSAIPIQVWQFALDHADNDDDRVWLGRAHHAILVGRFSSAAKWIEACLRQRPDDPAVWRARLDLALATDDVAGFWTAVAHVPADRLDATAIQELRVWLVAHHGNPAVEQRELTALVRDAPGNTQALERLAVLATQAGQVPEAAQFRHRKAEVDHTQHQLDLILRNRGIDSSQAEILARLAATLGRTFDARAWAIVAEAKRSASDPAGGGDLGPGAHRPFPTT